MAELLFSDLILSCLLRIFLSFVAGFLLGLERKTRSQVVGMRTLILITVSSCLLGILSTYMAGVNDLGFKVVGDPTRIAAGVVSGVGFLGGGAILRQGLNIKGLTSAAIIWTAMAVGLSFGSGLYIPSIVVVIVVLISLPSLEKIEEKLFPNGKSKTLKLTFERAEVDIEEINAILKSFNVIVTDVNVTRIFSSSQIILHYVIKTPKMIDYKSLCDKLNENAPLGEFSLDD